MNSATHVVVVCNSLPWIAQCSCGLEPTDLLETRPIDTEGQMKSKPLSLLFALLGLTAMLFGQATDSNLSGMVTDSSGAALPAAKVELTNQATGVKTSTTTDNNGQYRFNNMPIGRYDVTASASGFTSATVKGLDLQLNKSATGNITLQVGAVSSTVNVTEAASTIDTTTAQVQSTFKAPDFQPPDHRKCQRTLRGVEPVAPEFGRSEQWRCGTGHRPVGRRTTADE